MSLPLRYLTCLLNDKSTLITRPQFGHFISIIPVVGVTLSKMRQSHLGHLFTILKLVSLTISDTSVHHIGDGVRIVKIVFVQQSEIFHSYCKSLFGASEIISKTKQKHTLLD